MMFGFRVFAATGLRPTSICDQETVAAADIKKVQGPNKNLTVKVGESWSKLDGNFYYLCIFMLQYFF